LGEGREWPGQWLAPRPGQEIKVVVLDEDEKQRRNAQNTNVRSQTARILGITRTTLRARLAALGIAIERSMSIEEDALE
jgi:hypothetical protein